MIDDLERRLSRLEKQAEIDNDKLVDSKEICNKLSVSRSFLSRNKDRLPLKRVGNKLRMLESDLMHLVQNGITLT
jgi:hypothetical protein